MVFHLAAALTWPEEKGPTRLFPAGAVPFEQGVCLPPGPAPLTLSRLERGAAFGGDASGKRSRHSSFPSLMWCHRGIKLSDFGAM